MMGGMVSLGCSSAPKAPAARAAKSRVSTPKEASRLKEKVKWSASSITAADEISYPSLLWKSEPSDATSAEKVSMLELEKEFGPVDHELVQKWMAYFSTENREPFKKYLLRAERIRSVVEPILRKNGLPEELLYLALIESGFAVHAKSHAKAVGVWQFIEGTSKRYGLRTDRFVDERRDPVRATEAAAQYLRDLHNVFLSWPLALAAYNSGENRVLRAIMSAKTRDFWSLIRKDALPKETQDYVPKFIAAVQLARNAERYGFDLGAAKRLPPVEGVALPSALRVSDIERLANLQEKSLLNWNPHLLRGVIPEGLQGEYSIWVPAPWVQKVRLAKTRLDRLISSDPR